MKYLKKNHVVKKHIWRAFLQFGFSPRRRGNERTAQVPWAIEAECSSARHPQTRAQTRRRTGASQRRTQAGLQRTGQPIPLSHTMTSSDGGRFCRSTAHPTRLKYLARQLSAAESAQSAASTAPLNARGLQGWDPQKEISYHFGRHVW